MWYRLPKLILSSRKRQIDWALINVIYLKYIYKTEISNDNKSYAIIISDMRMQNFHEF